ncbi:hypothetical protein [Methylobacterium sp. A54F]
MVEPVLARSGPGEPARPAGRGGGAPRALRRPPLRSLVLAVLAGIAILRAAAAPDPNLWPAAALLAGLGLDTLGRALLRRPAARVGVPAAFGLPSLVLGLGEALGLAAGALALLLWPDAFPVLASALAGLVAIGACARLALARILSRLARSEDLTAP